LIEGICPNCGTRYVGWALSNPRYQTCRNCGGRLDIKERYQTAEEENLKLMNRDNLKQTRQEN